MLVCECVVLRLVDSVSTSFSYTAEELQPYTEYQFRLLVSHGHGETASPWVPLITAQDRKYSGCVSVCVSVCVCVCVLNLSEQIYGQIS